jgi:RHS repeat-associated protein
MTSLQQPWMWIRTAALAVVAANLLAPVAHAQSGTYSETRTSSFTYYGPGDGPRNGMLASETVEPDRPQLCVVTTRSYDDYGNKAGAGTSNCAGASGRAVFTSRSASTAFAAIPVQPITVAGAVVNVEVSAGIFATSGVNAVGHAENSTYDPRFGLPLTLRGPNQLTTSWVVDDFGRQVLEKRSDNTSVATAWCVIGAGLDASGNSTGCPVPGASEVPAGAVSFTHKEARDANGNKMGPFSRVYSDRLGREIRSVTESFDGAGQPTGRSGALLVTDSVYSPFGARVLQTQAYFLSSGSSTTAGSNDVGIVRTEVDMLGRPTAIYVVDSNGGQASVAFGAFGSRRASLQSISYQGLKTTSMNDKGQSRSEEKNAVGEVIRVTDASGAQLAHQHDAFGNLVATKDALQNVVSIEYDARGRRTRLLDPDAGTIQYDYDALGQLLWQQNPLQVAQATQTTMTYDRLGRMTRRDESEYVSYWFYDKNEDGSSCVNGEASKGAGRLCESRTSTGIRHRYAYDALGRPLANRTDTGTGPSFGTGLAYDAVTGRVASQTYPTGLQVGYGYTARGFLEKASLLSPANVQSLPDAQGQTSSTALAAGALLWQARVVNAWSRTEQQGFGNNVVGRSVFDPASGRMVDALAGSGPSTSVLSQHYAWDSLGNLTARIDNNGDGGTGAVSETFNYGDNLNRLTGYTVTAPAIPGLSRAVAVQYNALGMLLYKSDVGNYAYGAQGAGAARPHALQSLNGAQAINYAYDANGNLKTASAGKYQGITYTSFNLPDSQTGAQGPGGSPKYTWQYDENHARLKELRSVASSTDVRTVWYLNPDNKGGLGFEREELAAAASNRHYLTPGGEAVGVLVSNGALPPLAGNQFAPTPLASAVLVKVEYWHRDHLGSIAATTDHAGALTARHAYDPFGKRRYTNGRYDQAGNLVIDWSSASNAGTGRGFTGHEHLDDIGLVHMNGRVFDPNLGLFLQSDPFVQNPGNLQNYNRYGYCFNNPLTCTDPSGQVFGIDDLFIALVIIWGAEKAGIIDARLARSLTGIAVSMVLPGSQGLLAQAGVSNGLAQAAISGFVSGAISTGNLSGAMQGAFTAGAFNQAGDFLNAQGAFSGGTAYGEISGVGVALHGVVGCVTSVAGGGKCGPGALSAAFSQAATPMKQGLDVVSGTVVSAVIGGTASVLGGGKFANGAQTGAFGYLYNCAAHKCTSTDYDPKDPRTHFSAPQSTGTICNLQTDGCLSAVQTEMGCYSAPGQSGCTSVGQEKSYDLTGVTSANPITQYRVNDNMLINGTSPSHIFNDGYVVRWVAVDSIGNVAIWSAGYGTNSGSITRWANQIGGPMLFNDIGVQNKVKVQCNLKLRSFEC